MMHGVIGGSGGNNIVYGQDGNDEIDFLTWNKQIGNNIAYMVAMEMIP